MQLGDHRRSFRSITEGCSVIRLPILTGETSVCVSTIASSDDEDGPCFSLTVAGLDRGWGPLSLLHWVTTGECQCVPLCVHWPCSFSSGQDSVQKTVRSCLFSTGGLPSAVSCGGRRGWVNWCPLSVDTQWDLYSVHTKHPLVCSGHCVYTVYTVLYVYKELPNQVEGVWFICGPLLASAHVISAQMCDNRCTYVHPCTHAHITQSMSALQ